MAVDGSLIATAFSNVLILVLGILLGRKKKKADLSKTEAETENLEVQSASEVVKMWKSLALEFKQENQALRIQVIELKKITIELKAENRLFRHELEELKRQTKT